MVAKSAPGELRGAVASWVGRPLAVYIDGPRAGKWVIKSVWNRERWGGGTASVYRLNGQTRRHPVFPGISGEELTCEAPSPKTTAQTA